MARSRRSPDAEPPPAVTADRAARLCRLIRMTGTRGQPRETLLQRLNIDVRGFYRDLKLLRDVGIVIELVRGKYTLRGDAEEAVLKVPFPDPHLTLGEATLLGKGRSAVHRKVQELLKQVLPK
jgi:hypothetical protein